MDTISLCCLSVNVGRGTETLAYVTKYLRAVSMFRDYNNSGQDPDFTQVSGAVAAVQAVHGSVRWTCRPVYRILF